MDINREIEENSKKFKLDLENEIQLALSGYSNVESDEPPGFSGDSVLFGNQPPSLKADEYLKAALGWVYGCVRAISDSIAAVPLRLYKFEKGEVTEVDEHPALALLEKPNSYCTRVDHFFLTQEYLELTGESPWFIQRDKNGLGDPTSILLLRPDRLTIVQSKDKNSDSPIEKYTFKTDDGKDVDIKNTEMLFLKYPDTTNMFRGKGTLAAAAKTVDIDNFSEDYNKRFFHNSARPDSILTTDQKLSVSQRSVLQQQVKKLYQGKSNAHKTAILESGLTWTPMSVSAKDMDFLAQQNFGMAKIFSIFGVPKAVMAISDDVNLANAKTGEYIFAKYTIKPKMKRIVAQLNEFYLPMFKGTENMFFSFDDPVPQDNTAVIQKFDSALGKGWMTINEVREEQNLSSIGDDGDQIYLPNNYVPIDMAGQVTPAGIYSVKNDRQKSKGKRLDLPGIIERSAGGYRSAVIKSKTKEKQKEKNNQAIQKIDEQISNLAVSMVTGLVRQRKQQVANRQREKQQRIDRFVAVYMNSIASFERIFKTGMTVIFKNQLRKLLNKVPEKSLKAEEVKVNINEWQINEDEETEIMVRVFSPTTGQMIKEQGEKAMQLTGAQAGSFSMATEAVQEYLRERTFKFSFEVNEETNRILKDTLAKGVAEGESIPQLRKRVSEVFGDMEKYRAERIARSEVVRASNFAATEAYTQSGVVEGMQWLVTPDDRLCPYCEPLDGKTISLQDSFFEKGDKVTGSDGTKFDLNYEDVDFPPLHSNCRCTVVPIVK